MSFNIKKYLSRLFMLLSVQQSVYCVSAVTLERVRNETPNAFQLLTFPESNIGSTPFAWGKLAEPISALELKQFLANYTFPYGTQTLFPTTENRIGFVSPLVFDGKLNALRLGHSILFVYEPDNAIYQLVVSVTQRRSGEISIRIDLNKIKRAEFKQLLVARKKEVKTPPNWNIARDDVQFVVNINFNGRSIDDTKITVSDPTFQ